MTLKDKDLRMFLNISLRMRNAEVSSGPKAKREAKAARVNAKKEGEMAALAAKTKVIAKPKAPARVRVAA